MQKVSGILTAALLSLGLGGPGATQESAKADPFAGRPEPYGQLCTPDHHEAPNGFTADGKTFFFTRTRQDFKASTVLEAAWQSGAWGEAKPLPFSGSSHDAGVSPSPDGRRLFFTSKRPAEGLPDEWNIWTVERSESGQWGTPVPLEAPINGPRFECCFVARADVVYFSSNRDGAWEIFRAKRVSDRFTDLEKLPAEINGAKHGQWPSYADPQDRFLIFSSIRAGGLGGDDLYISFRREGGWTPARNLGPGVNTAGYEDNGILSPDGKLFLWSSRRTDKGISDIYEADASVLDLPDGLQ